MNRTAISEDIRESLKLVPVSWLLHNSLRGSISFEQWFALTRQLRHERRTAVSEIPLEFRTQSSDLANYEAQQAPLAYIGLAPFDAALDGIELPQRVFGLRLIASLISALLILYAARLLLTTLEVERAFRLAALACIFESQMLWASVAHVENDWLSIPLSMLFFALLGRVVSQNRTRQILAFSAVLAAGLLTKAYFLALFRYGSR